MKVLQVITDRDRRGAQVFATDLHSGLEAIGVDVTTVALTKGSHGDLLDIGVLGPSRRSTKTLRALRRRARAADVVIAHGSATLLACAIGLIGSGTPFIYRQISDPMHWAASWPRRLRVAAFLRRAAGIVVLSPSVAAVLGQHYRLGSKRMTVIPNAVPASEFTPSGVADRQDARASFAMPADAVAVLYLGALAKEKGVDIAILAVAEQPHCALLVVGDGPERASLAELARTLAPMRVVFTGSLQDPRTALTAADVVVLPSRGGDSMPAALIEAGLAGLPCVSTPVGAIADVVIDGVTGLITPIGDQPAFTAAIDRIAQDAALRERLGSAARDHCAAHFTIEATAPMWLALINSIVR